MADQILLYDGTCGFCAASVQFILRHERKGTLKFAPLQGRFASELRSRHSALDGVDSMVWVDDPGAASESVKVRSDAVLKAAEYLGRHWSLAQLGRVLPARARDAAYDFVARHRHKITRTPELCYIPPPAVRARFLE